MQDEPADAWRTVLSVQVPMGQQNGACRAAGQTVFRCKIPSGVQHGDRARRAVGRRAVSGWTQCRRRIGRAVPGVRVPLGEEEHHSVWHAVPGAWHLAGSL